jgi:hypothetical protein
MGQQHDGSCTILLRCKMGVQIPPALFNSLVA